MSYIFLVPLAWQGCSLTLLLWKTDCTWILFSLNCPCRLNNFFYSFLVIYRYLLYYVISYNTSVGPEVFVGFAMVCLFVGLIAFGMCWDERTCGTITSFSWNHILKLKLIFLVRKNLPWDAQFDWYHWWFCPWIGNPCSLAHSPWICRHFCYCW